MSKIVQLVPKEVGASFRFDADEMLDRFKGKPIDRLLIIAGFEDGSYEIDGNCNTGEALFLMERAKSALMADED